MENICKILKSTEDYPQKNISKEFIDKQSIIISKINYTMLVNIINKGKEGLTICFKVKEIINGKEYLISNCHRTESALWRSHCIQCYVGNVELDFGIIKKAHLRIDYRNARIELVF